MTNKIVTTDLSEAIAKELKVDTEGKGFISRRGLARLCGVQYQSWGRSDSYFTLEIDEYLAQNGFKVTAKDLENGIPDIIAAEMIGFYAEEKGNPVAKQSSRAFRAIGLRSYIQQTLDWKPPIRLKLSDAEIIELFCLAAATGWERRFSEQYYEQLSRLTGLTAFGSSRPQRWAQLTKQLVYDWLPSGVYDRIKCCKAETGSYAKLHQFLSEDGIRVFTQHHQTLLTLMSASRSLDQLMELLRQSCSGQYQLGLFEKSPNRKAIAK